MRIATLVLASVAAIALAGTIDQTEFLYHGE